MVSGWRGWCCVRCLGVSLTTRGGGQAVGPDSQQRRASAVLGFLFSVDHGVDSARGRTSPVVCSARALSCALRSASWLYDRVVRLEQTVRRSRQAGMMCPSYLLGSRVPSTYSLHLHSSRERHLAPSTLIPIPIPIAYSYSTPLTTKATA